MPNDSSAGKTSTIRALITRIGKVINNPFKLFVALTHLGWFKKMNDELYLRLLYRGEMGKKLHLTPPRTFDEKLQWLKLHDKNPIYPQLCDKIAVRDFVRERVGDTHITPIFGIWDDPDKIDFSTLPEQFVLKCTHDSGGVILCPNKSELDRDAVRASLKKWLMRDYSIAGREWPYHFVPRRVFAEAFLPGTIGARPDDYKFYCFDGVVRIILLCTNHRKTHTDYLYFDTELRPYPINALSIALPKDYKMPIPPHLNEMLEIARQLSAGFPHVRVDLFDTPGGVRFGEITLYDRSGLNIDFSYEGDLDMGNMLNLGNFSFIRPANHLVVNRSVK
jgi:hypothetical protein